MLPVEALTQEDELDLRVYLTVLRRPQAEAFRSLRTAVKFSRFGSCNR